MPTKPKNEESTAIAPIEEKNHSLVTRAVDPYADIEFADDGVDESKVNLAWPDLKLIQGTTRGIKGSERFLGYFYHPDTDEFTETLDVIPLAVREQRAFFEDMADSPACISLNNINPEPNQLLWQKEKVMVKGVGEMYVGDMPQPALCVDCPFSKFGEDGSAPACGETILMMVQREDGSFARFRIGRTGLKPVRKAISRLISGSRRMPVYSALWTFGSESIEKGSRKWMQLTVRTQPLERDQIIEINETVKMIRGETDQVAREAAFEAGPSDAGNVIDVEY